MFIQKLKHLWKKNQSLLCVGLDPDLNKIPNYLKSLPDSIFQFNKIIIDQTSDLVCSYKPQMAYYSGQNIEEQLHLTIDYLKKYYPEIPIILDSKRADIGPTAAMYAKESFECYRADAVTVNPYMGSDTIQAFTEYKDKGVIILCKTSNPGSMDFQNLVIGEKKLFELVAEKAVGDWNANNNILLVVGATYPNELRQIRKIVNEIPLLIPGIGAQGGDLQAVLESGLDSNKQGVLINISRAINYVSVEKDFPEKVRTVTKNYFNQINDIRSHL